MTEQELLTYIDSVKWKFAKTMPQWPHWYTMIQWNPEGISKFAHLATLIFTNGYDVKLGKRTYRYLDIGEFKYWSMDESIEKTDLINRAYIDNRKVLPKEMVNVFPKIKLG